MSLSFAKSRILLSRMGAGVALLFYFLSSSRWDVTDPVIADILFSAGLIFVAIGSMGRMWSSIYIAGYKDSKLITYGPYSIVRHPLYLFSFIGLLGVGMTTETFTFPIIFLIFFALGYPTVMRAEENKLRKIFGKEYDEYANSVPAFIPNFSTFKEPKEYLMNPTIYRRHIFSALWFIWIVALFELIEGLKETGIVGNLWLLY